MAEQLSILRSSSKKEQYEYLLSQIESILGGENDMIANMANLSAILKTAFGFLWVGFYIIKEDQLVLGPFQGNLACTRIKYGKGVCGTAWKKRETIVVANVNDFEGHIVCDSNSVSEIVVPIIDENNIIAVLDVDSEKENNFDDIDAFYLEKIVNFLIK